MLILRVSMKGLFKLGGSGKLWDDQSHLQVWFGCNCNWRRVIRD